MIHDKQITISVGHSRKETRWQPQTILISELYERFRTPARGKETLNEYLNLTKPQQDELKDVGGYVLGTLRGPRRKAASVVELYAIVHDIDNIRAGETQDILRRLDGLGCSFCTYSTRKHHPAAPRLRTVMPTDRPMTPDEVEPVSRMVARLYDPSMSVFDPTTFEPSRLMYWPSCNADGEYIFTYVDKPFLSVDGILAMYKNWHNMSEWPQVPGAPVATQKLAAKQEDPLAKSGVVGAFNRVYSIPAAMDAFLPGVYEPCDTGADRYTYTGGSTTGGAVVYDNGKFLFSHHASDPCSGKLVNAFDLIRLHKFEDLDDEAPEGSRGNRLPSYVAMCEFARTNPATADELARAKAEELQADFGGITDENAGEELAKCEGRALSAQVVRLSLHTFGIQARNNLITGRVDISGLPPVYSIENAANTLPVFLLDRLKSSGIKAVNKTAITDYLANICDENRFNPVTDILAGTVWDGFNRVPALLNILNVDSNSLSAVLIWKWLIQCVALANNTLDRQESAEGVLTLQGPQGTGKTMFFRRLALKNEWFVEGTTLDLKDKDSIIRAVSGWITELGELDATLRRDQSSLKAFITSPSDRIRSPYAREPATRPRRTSFCATVNPSEFLRDDTGDRRFWVVPIQSIDMAGLLSLPKDWIIQLWAQVYTAWLAAPQSFRMSSYEMRALDLSNLKNREPLPGEDEIREALNFDLPADKWVRYSSSQLKSKLLGRLDHIDAIQIGRILSKLAREDERITFTKPHNVKTYLLPIPDSPFALVKESNIVFSTG